MPKPCKHQFDITEIKLHENYTNVYHRVSCRCCLCGALVYRHCGLDLPGKLVYNYERGYIYA